PVAGDPQDNVYLPLAGEVQVRKPIASAGTDLPAISIVCAGPSVAAPQSALRQDYPRLEVLAAVADPGDANRVRTWRPAPGQPPAATINEGLQLARGEVLGWLGTGDLLSDSALADVGSAFAADPDLDLVCGNSLCLDDQNRPRPMHWGHGTTAFCYGRAE